MCVWMVRGSNTEMISLYAVLEGVCTNTLKPLLRELGNAVVGIHDPLQTMRI